ncbi:MAG: DUF6010 family protein [Caldilineaceae bacterium]
MLNLWLLLGLVLGALFVIAARSQGVHKERVILAVGLPVAALIYVGFAAMWGDRSWLAIEVVGLLLYSLFLFLARRYHMVWLAVGWGLHPLWDLVLHWLGPGYTVAPAWYVLACLSFDLLVAGYLLVRLNIWNDLPRIDFGRI